ncbi:2Fe-2S iron-sulfur cluster-binding protein [Streptomyces sp. CAU 1734]|uniref:(2Fe-2S)-binding protein n=1 Tax=Streptomyces sp. CAU 1734 TaxID=3140360 RepID=UPI003260E8F9
MPHGEYDHDATAFVQLPTEEDLGGAPLEAPGHGYVPPMIRPLTPAADPQVPGEWRIPHAQDHVTEHVQEHVQEHGPEPVREHAREHGRSQQQPPAQSWPEAGTGQPGRPAHSGHSGVEHLGVDHHDVDHRHGGRGADDPQATEQWVFHDTGRAEPGPGAGPPADGTGEWTIPAARGDLSDETGEFTTAMLRDQWNSAPATLPGGATAPWATEPPATLPGGAPAPWAPAEHAPADHAPADHHAPADDAPAGHVPVEHAPVEQAFVESPHAPVAEPPAPEAEAPAPGPAAEAPVPQTPVREQEQEQAQEREAEPEPEAESGTEPDPDTEAEFEPEPEAATGPEADAEAETDPEGEAGEADLDPVFHTPADEHPLTSYVLSVNGTDCSVADAWIGESLLYVLRERLGLAGAKDGCSQGECGACNVQVDGRLVASCMVPAATTAGSEVRTVEGLATDGEPSDVQRALAACGAVQCGFCIPGMAMTVHDLLEGNHHPTELETRQALCGNLCRCTGYRGVLDAVRDVVAGREAAAGAAAEAAEATSVTGATEARIPHQAPPGAGSVQPHPHDGGMA